MLCRALLMRNGKQRKVLPGKFAHQRGYLGTEKRNGRHYAYESRDTYSNIHGEKQG
jgi:hypothetical protein